jgi:hypothetical protein
LRQLRGQLAQLPTSKQRYSKERLSLKDEIQRLLHAEDGELNRLWPEKYPAKPHEDWEEWAVKAVKKFAKTGRQRQ